MSCEDNGTKFEVIYYVEVTKQRFLFPYKSIDEIELMNDRFV